MYTVSVAPQEAAISMLHFLNYTSKLSKAVQKKTVLYRGLVLLYYSCHSYRFLTPLPDHLSHDNSKQEEGCVSFHRSTFFLEDG